MTPLATKWFREGDELTQRFLAGCQFFECTAIFPLAHEMVTADVEAGATGYSEMARLPASASVFEFVWGVGRVLLIAEEKAEGWIEYEMRAPVLGKRLSDRGEVRFLFGSGFKTGTVEHRQVEYDREVMVSWLGSSGLQMTVEAFTQKQAIGFCGIVEKLLCLINQPGLVDQRPHTPHKAVARSLARLAPRAPMPRWHECRIHPGTHGVGNDARNSESREHQLHYVRRHFKPSSERWVDGYWRGNADLGIHLKWYSAKPAKVSS